MAEQFGISRLKQDEFAVLSHAKLAISCSLLIILFVTSYASFFNELLNVSLHRFDG